MLTNLDSLTNKEKGILKGLDECEREMLWEAYSERYQNIYDADDECEAIKSLAAQGLLKNKAEAPYPPVYGITPRGISLAIYLDNEKYE
jgi:hypothetical protein